MNKLILAAVALAIPGAALAADAVSLSSSVLVERHKRDAAGRDVTVLEAPKVVVPGDRLTFVLEYRNGGAAPARDFTVTNPIPKAVSYLGAERAPIVSVDGGKNWGALATLKVAGADGKLRAATPADVTHIRWTLAQPIPAGGTGKLSFRGIVK